MLRAVTVPGLLLASLVCPLLCAQDDAPQARAQQRPRSSPVLNATIEPHWFAGGQKFWYRRALPEGKYEFILVDAAAGSKSPAFDHTRLGEALAKAAEMEAPADRLPIERVEFLDDGKTIRFSAKGARWECNLETYAVAKTDAPPPTDPQQPPPGGRGRRPGQQGRGGRGPFGDPFASPDGVWTAFIKDHNLYVRNKEGKEFALTTDGKEGLAYGMPRWSPDSKRIAAWRIEPGDRKMVHLISSSPREGGRATLQSREYPLPGDKFTAYEPYLFVLKSEAAEGDAPFSTIKVDTDKVDFGFPMARWTDDSSAFRYTKVDRGHQRYRVIEVNGETGAVRNIIDERTDTFIWTIHTETLNLQLLNPLDKTNEYIYVSEVDGWRHLYLIDGAPPAEGETPSEEPAVSSPGKQLFARVKNRITSGEYVIRGIDLIDEEKRQIWFQAGGKNPGEDPYFVHYYRVNFDGTDLVALTEGNGHHTIAYSPTREYLIDTYSRVDAPPVHNLRRVSDGSLICELEKCDISALQRNGFRLPEVFVAKGRDGKTDIWGMIQRPRNFDPKKKYPVIEDIYAGPQGAFVPKTFSPFDRWADLTELGFIVVKIDGMGTAYRSKAFHDVCYKNLKDAGFPDRILWMKAAAETRPEMDLTRVGVFGTSAGGQNAAGAVIFHSDFYKAAAAACGCHDNRMDKSSWNEQWMGYPVGPQYSESSNIDNAHRLGGHLHLMVGELDTNVPPESTLRLVDALIKANKDFDFLLMPGVGHSNGGPYGVRRRNEFFVRHLRPDLQPSTATSAAALTQPASAAETSTPAQPASGAATRPETRSETPAASGSPLVTKPPRAFFEIVDERDREAAMAFYEKYIEVQGLPVVAAKVVDDRALLRTHEIVGRMLAGRPDILEAMAKNKMYLIIIGKDQFYTDMPEYRRNPNPAYMNERVRGTGGRPTSFGEENLLCLSSDRYDDESIGVHEFCHTIDTTLGTIDPEWRQKKNGAYRQAMEKGLWKNTYAATNPAEYWAEICQCYFDCNRVNNWNHGPIGTREQLRDYDPVGYELVRKTFNLTPENDWRYSYLQTMPAVEPPPASWGVDPFYTKSTAAREFRILGRGASDDALLKANHTIRGMFAYRHDIIKALIADGVRLVVLGRGEKLADLPEVAARKEDAQLDRLARCLSYSPELKLLVIDEANLMADKNAPLVGDSQIVRLMADAAYQVCGKRPVDPNWENRGREVQQYELRVKRLDETFDKRLGELYDAAVAAGKWKGSTAIHSRAAYWAQGVLAYFDASAQTHAPEGAARPITTREALREYDPGLFALVDETMAFEGRVDWRLK